MMGHEMFEKNEYELEDPQMMFDDDCFSIHSNAQTKNNLFASTHAGYYQFH